MVNIPSGKRLQFAIEHGPVEPEDFPMKNGDIFQFAMLVFPLKMVDFPMKNADLFHFANCNLTYQNWTPRDPHGDPS